MPRMSEQQKEEFETDAKERAAARRELLSNGVLNMLVGKKKILQHPLDIAFALEGYGEWLIRNEFISSLAALAAYMGFDKQIIYDAGLDKKSYYYYELQDCTGEPLEVRKIETSDELEYVKHGSNICMTGFIDIEKLIDNYLLKHPQNEFSREEIKSQSKRFYKEFHKHIKSKKNHRHLVTTIHKIWASKSVLVTTVDRRRKISKTLNLDALIDSTDSKSCRLKQLYRFIITGSAIVRNTTFPEILQYHKTVAELEWVKSGQNSRNPAMSIFMAINSFGYAPIYQNKTISEFRPTLSALEEQSYQERLEVLLGSQKKLEK